MVSRIENLFSDFAHNFGSHPALKAIQQQLTALTQKVEHLMSAITDFAAKVNGYFDKQDAAVADIVTEMKDLNDQIAKLQGTSGAITPEDQALLDGVQARAASVTDKVAALDTIVKPVVPTP